MERNSGKKYPKMWEMGGDREVFKSFLKDHYNYLICVSLHIHYLYKLVVDIVVDIIFPQWQRPEFPEHEF